MADQGPQNIRWCEALYEARAPGLILYGRALGLSATESEDVAVYIAARHGCCENRGIGAHSSLTQTTVLHGQFHDASVKKEFFDNIALQQSYNEKQEYLF